MVIATGSPATRISSGSSTATSSRPSSRSTTAWVPCTRMDTNARYPLTSEGTCLTTMRPALLAITAALMTGGCAGATLSPQRDAVGTVQTFLAQCARDRPLAVMETLVPGARREFLAAHGTLAGCARVLRTRRFRAARPHLRSFSGSRATVDVGEGELEPSFGGGFWRIEAS